MNIPTDSRGSLVESLEVAEGFQGTFRQKSDRKTEIYYVCIYLLFDSIFLGFFAMDSLMFIPTDSRGTLVESLEVGGGSQGVSWVYPNQNLTEKPRYIMYVSISCLTQYFSVFSPRTA